MDPSLIDGWLMLARVRAAIDDREGVRETLEGAVSSSPTHFSPGVALEAALLDWDHRDPVDRMIACVARSEGLPLISRDAIFDDLGLRRVWLT